MNLKFALSQQVIYFGDLLWGTYDQIDNTHELMTAAMSYVHAKDMNECFERQDKRESIEHTYTYVSTFLEIASIRTS